MLKYRMKIKNEFSYVRMIACLRLQVKFYFILTHNNLIFISKIRYTKYQICFQRPGMKGFEIV